MTREHWPQIKGVLELALGLAPEERSAFLDRSCSRPPSLRQEVYTLLSAKPRGALRFHGKLRLARHPDAGNQIRRLRSAENAPLRRHGRSLSGARELLPAERAKGRRAL